MTKQPLDVSFEDFVVKNNLVILLCLKKKKDTFISIRFYIN